MKVYCDSSLQETCYVVDDGKPTILAHEGKTTNNQGEYLAVIRALNICYHQGLRGFNIYTDSQLLVRQVNARIRKDYVSPYITRNLRLRDLGTLLIVLLQDCQAELHHIAREKNPAGIALERFHHKRILKEDTKN